MENNKNKKSVKFQGDMLNYCDFIQVFVFTSYHHLNRISNISRNEMDISVHLRSTATGCFVPPLPKRSALSAVCGTPAV